MSENLLKACGLILGVGLVCGVLSFFVWFLNSSNPDVPAGYVGYQTQGAVFGQGKFYGTLKGPASPGRTWMVKSFPVSITPYTYAEEFSGESEVLSKDNLKINYRIHIVWRIKEDSVKDAVEKFSTIDTTGKIQDPEKVVKDIYGNYLKEPLRTFSRDEVQKLNWVEIKEKQVIIGDNIKNNMLKLTKDTPFDIISVVVGNIQYPKVVSDAVADNLATTQHLEKERKDAERRVVQAEGIAKSMEIINQRLTSQYLQHEAIEAQKSMVNSPNHTVIYIPVGNMGIPLVGTIDAGKK